VAKQNSHPICPTCESDLTGRTELPRFCGEGGIEPHMADSVAWLYEETNTLVRFLGALAQAAPLAVAFYVDEIKDSPDWTFDLGRLAEELTAETQWRLYLLREASHIRRDRAAGREG
jgi:hypothetical protein